MKKYFNIVAMLLLVLAVGSTSCKNEVDEIFDEDAVTRLENAQAEYTKILTDNGGKWQLEYYANDEEPGYIYVMTFKADGTVTISGANKWIGYINGATLGAIGYGSETSLWDVITDNGPVLSFNTYNKYFHLFADPYNIPDETDKDDDETGYGHEGDYEFDIMKYSNDTLYLTGKKHGIDMIMTRIDGSINDEQYMNEVVAMADSFFNAKIPQVYINLPSGERWIVEDGATQILGIYKEGADRITTIESYPAIITHDGLSFMNAITLDGYTIKNFIRQADGSLLCRDDNQTTMTADPLGTLMADTTLTWRMDLNSVGGTFATLINNIKSDLTSYNKSTLVYIQLAYVSGTGYTLTLNVKKGSSKYNPTYYCTVTKVGDTQVKITANGDADKAGVTYAERCAGIKSFIEALNGTTFDLSANSLLAPVNMKMSTSSSDYMVWNLQ